VSEKRVLRRIFESKKEEITVEWRKLHNEVLNDLCSSPNIFRILKSRIMGWEGHVACLGEIKVVYRVLYRKTEGKCSFGRPRPRREDDTKMDFREAWRGLR